MAGLSAVRTLPRPVSTTPPPAGGALTESWQPTQPGKTAPMPGVTTQAQNQYAWEQTPFGQLAMKTNYTKPAGAGAGLVDRKSPILPSGPMPIDDGKVAYERQLESDRIMRERDAAAASRAALEGADLAETDRARTYNWNTRAADDNQRRLLALLDQLGGPFSSFFGQGGATAPPVSGADTDWEAALAAGMGRAKDTAAQAVGASRRAMLSNMAERGISGSGIERKADQAIQLAGAGQIGEAARQQAEQGAARKAAVADRNYAGAITQRGQDLQAAQAKMALLPSLMSLFRVSASY